ncbi:MAG: class I poly(R)-hydroxyalkanoic acid synthase [Magnetospirillum sp. WYHS-4]
MAEQTGTPAPTPDPEDLVRNMAEIASRSQRLVTEFLARQAAQGGNGSGFGVSDPLNIGSAFMDMTSRLMTDPAKLVQAQMSLWQDYLKLWQSTTSRFFGQESAPVIEPDKADRRFKDQEWTENEVFNYIKQSYLLTSRWMRSTVVDVDGMEGKDAQKVDFYTRQFIDAMSPSNFVMTNPEVLRVTLESKGENLVNGLKNLLDDLERGKGRLAISMTDYDAFQVGGNVANTPGKIVFRNDLMELIQYNPTTETVVQAPLLIVPPWINKFYILDLREKNSFIKWAVDQGHTVFVISWVNPDETLRDKDFTAYMKEGPLAAIEAVQKATGEDHVNAIGYCIGGTLLASTLAYMTAKGDDRIKSATFFTTMLDFTDAGELAVFIDEDQIAGIEEKMAERGYLEGSEMATTFNMLRANDLIWSFVVNNYLLGKDPFPFDLLYWNSDSTRMPEKMHSFYLRKMYLENKLIEPGGITLDGVDIDLRTVKTPSYFLSTRDDHIAPWKSTYQATQFFKGPMRFVLSASGHIAGVINPPAAGKYCYWTSDKKPGRNADDWFAGTTQTDGSWWPDWDAWVKKHAGKKPVPARVPGKGKLKVLDDAPGPYVKARIV